MKSITTTGLFFFVYLLSYGQKVYHVSLTGADYNQGTKKSPLRTIMAAAYLASPGDTIIVHKGTYREYINPPRGGESDIKRITYKAAPGELVIIKGSEPVKNWIQIQNDTWKTTISNSFFGNFNPYKDTIRGDWFDNKGRTHHTGSVYINGNWLLESPTLENVLSPVIRKSYWYGMVTKDSTTIWAQFKGLNPNVEQIEINTRQTIFYPRKTGINYITVSGFNMSQAATPWAPPTAEQIGLIGTNWSKGWIIENNTISYSRCTGISLGKYGDQFDNVAPTADAYNKTIQRALKNGWNKETIGHHIVRYNTISYCEEAGIVGSLGCVFSTIVGNTIHDIYRQKLFAGSEMAAIKFHAPVDMIISGNHVYNNGCGIWLDWMAQGTHISRNLLHGNEDYDIFFEVNHGPYIVENNIMLSPNSQRIWSQGGLYAHNIIAGRIDIRPFEYRETPFLKPHSTEIAGLHINPTNDIRFYNNIFSGSANLKEFDTISSIWMSGNIFLNKAKPSIQEINPIVDSTFNPELKLTYINNKYYLSVKVDPNWYCLQKRSVISTSMLGKVKIVEVQYEYPDGATIILSKDYFGKDRNKQNPAPGPFQSKTDSTFKIQVWPIPNRE